jgi:hypothetical protein
VHDQPYFHPVDELRVQHRNEILVAPGNTELTRADSEARAQRGELRKFIVRAKRKHFPRARQYMPFQQLRVCLVAIIANQRVVSQLVHSTRLRAALEVQPVTAQSDVDASDSFGDPVKRT